MAGLTKPPKAFIIFAHGYASIIANNALAFDEKVVSAHLEQAYRGAILAAQEEEK